MGEGAMGDVMCAVENCANELGAPLDRDGMCEQCADQWEMQERESAEVSDGE